MYTADDAREGNKERDQADLDERIEYAVRNNRCGNGATIRVYIEDSFCRSIGYELERRGFKNVDVPSITLKGDVYFEWDE